jgi:predicted nucleotidyltransferase component of viral defense system
MTIEADQIAPAARATGFDPTTLEKVLRLKELLREFYLHPFLRGRLVLKGGTAINLFLVNLPRLSVDIDLNYIGQSDREAMLKEQPALERAIRQVIEGLGYRIQEGTNEHALRGLYLNYQNHLNRDDRIEVEINFLMRICVLPPTMRTAAKIASEAECRFPVLAIEELMAGKLKALIERSHPRDLYDAYHFLKSGVSHDRVMLGKITILFASTLNHDIRSYNLDRLDTALRVASFETLLYPMLRPDDRPRAADMLGRVKPLLKEIANSTDYTPFLDAMARGEYRPDLLFAGQPEISARVANHPALVWKARHTAAFLAKKPAGSRRPRSNPKKV